MPYGPLNILSLCVISRLNSYRYPVKALSRTALGDSRLFELRENVLRICESGVLPNSKELFHIRVDPTARS
jgi:hypothetical protein